jgi:sulfatase maturation enzyme AslB (radical SAM superfamily)
MINLSKDLNNNITINNQLSPTICPLPFMHTYIKANGAMTACCESQETQLSKPSDSTSFYDRWNNQEYKKLRQSLINGEKPAACQKCWVNEELGIESNRQEAWDQFNKGFFRSKNIQVTQSYQVAEEPSSIELKSSNLCNLKCRMCHPSSSFRIKEDREIIDLYRPGLTWKESPSRSQKTIDQLLTNEAKSLNNVKVVQFSGGEPLISTEQIDFVKSLLEKNPETIHLRYSTNLTHLAYMNTDYPELWKNFEQVNIKISLDGIDDVYDYIRVGANFESVLNNLNQLLSLNMKNLTFGIGFTTQAYNVFQLPEFLNFFEKLIPRDLITTHLLHSPALLMINIFPDEIKERIINKIQAQRTDLDFVINVLKKSLGQPTLWNSFCDYTNAMDKKYNLTKGFPFLLQKYLDGY